MASVHDPTPPSATSVPRGAPLSRAPPIPPIITAAAIPDGHQNIRGRDDVDVVPQLSALFLPAGRSFHNPTMLPRGGECVGAGNDGWLAVARVVPLSPLRNDGEAVRKIVFAPNPTPDDHVAVAIAGRRCLAYTNTKSRDDKKWMILDVGMGVGDDRLADLAFDTNGGKVYCVTAYGEVHVLHIDRTQRWPPIVEPLQPRAAERPDDDDGLIPFDRAAAYAPPFDNVSRFTGAENVFFLGGDVYPVWRNTSVAVSWEMPRRSRFPFRMEEGDVFVLKYDPGRRPCWNAADGLGGCSVFICLMNNPLVMRPEDFPTGVRGNCVYSIDHLSRSPMVFDMAAGISAPLVSPGRQCAVSAVQDNLLVRKGEEVMTVDDEWKETKFDDEDRRIVKKKKIHRELARLK
ncbi:hypothetical protein ACP4OV_027614 [Aristida adscensionis]